MSEAKPSARVDRTSLSVASPSVSIVTPAFNAASTIGSCIESVQQQHFQEWEMIVIDDGSTDATRETVATYSAEDPRIKLEMLEVNQGAAKARNTGILKATGRYLAFLDADDLWLPEKLKKQVAFMELHQYPLTCTYYGVLAAEQMRDSEIKESVLNGNPAKFRRTLRAKKQISYQQMLRYNSMGCLTVMYDTAFFGKRYFPDIPLRQDYALWLELLRETEAYCLEEVLAVYTEGSGHSLSANKLKASKWNWHVIRKRENVPFFKAALYFLNYSIRGVVGKYFN